MMSQITIARLLERKANGGKFAVLTCYDASFAQLLDDAGIEALLIGDSLGMVLQGQSSTLPVSVADIAYHTACVRRGNRNALIIADLPFASYATVEQAVDNAAELMRAGAHMVKLEGGDWLADSIIQLARQGIPTCAHLGLTPQSVNTLGGYRIQGRTPDQAEAILNDARRLEQAGAAMLVLECVPRELAAEVTRSLRIPVIGIGAGPDTDAQVLVLHDLLGLGHRHARFVRNFMAEGGSIQDAVTRYREAVLAGTYPGPEHCY